MKRMELLYSSEVQLENDCLMKLDYSLTESYSEVDSKQPYYGVHIKKSLEGVTEADEIGGISECREKVVKMIQTLFQYEVTPISMVEVIDDLVTLMD